MSDLRTQLREAEQALACAVRGAVMAGISPGDSAEIRGLQATKAQLDQRIAAEEAASTPTPRNPT